MGQMRNKKIVLTLILLRSIFLRNISLINISLINISLITICNCIKIDIKIQIKIDISQLCCLPPALPLICLLAPFTVFNLVKLGEYLYLHLYLLGLGDISLP